VSVVDDATLDDLTCLQMLNGMGVSLQEMVLYIHHCILNK